MGSVELPDAIGIPTLSGQFFDGAVTVWGLGVFLFTCHGIILPEKKGIKITACLLQAVTKDDTIHS